MLSDKINASNLEGNNQDNFIISQSESNLDFCNVNRKDSFLLHNAHKEIFEALTDEEAGQLIKGLFKYNCGETINFTGIVKIAFIPIKQLLDKNAEKYYAKCEKLKQNGQKGGRPTKKEKQKKPNGLLKNQMDIKKTISSSEYEYDYDYDYEYKKEIYKEKEKNKIPTKEEIKKYCDERKNNIDVEQFFLYYSDRDWKNKDGKPVNWKLCIITWEKNDKKYNQNKGGDVENELEYNPNI